MSDTFDSVVQDRQADIDKLGDRAVSREDELSGRQQQSVEARDKELKPLEDRTSAALTDVSSMQAPKPTPLPTWKGGPPIDAKEFHSFGMALIGMAMLGGAVSRGNWMGVSTTLNGAMQGFLDGKQDAAEKAYKDYQIKFGEAKAHDAQAQKEFEDILQNKKLTINSMLSQLKIAAAKYDRQDVRFAAEQKSIDAIWKQVEASKNSLGQMEERHDRMTEQIKAMLEKTKMTTGGDATKLSDKGREWVERSLILGDKGPMQMIASRFGAKQSIPIINDMAEKGIDPGDVVSGKASLKAYESALRATEVRKVGVERLTGAVQRMEKKILTLAEKVVPTGMPAANATINLFKKNLGDQDFAQFKTEITAVARQYIEAVTMPGSNAQLHASSQEMADEIIHSNMAVSQLIGVFKGMNDEIGAGSEALSDTSKRLHATIAGHGLTIAPPDKQGQGWDGGAAKPNDIPKSASQKPISLEEYLKAQGH